MDHVTTSMNPDDIMPYAESELWPSDVKVWYMLSWVLICGLIGLIAFPLSMLAIGFSVDGVVALSCAACTQSCIYGGATSGCFSIMQALGTQPLVMVIIGFIFGSVSGGLIANKIYVDHFDALGNSTITTTSMAPF
ncbi:Oidioi.mRNA.OKI2018_I69.PAR.g11982.t1.cds [Oikopleura dioica]|uniref:Oidioi.mRNA.OKI2018_I69.PAR.g11982.t1.cds n=1 Tax=Oikopleura dioica TaxID=34765 RepID=A0ABN7S4F5_OIKDI|nr:Oidioi.mRNA.OKI2018_I69.PAR.g11982.t1.cds [Oikopleura dioica]